MKFDINRYKAENDAVRLTEAQKNAIKSNAERSAKARAVRSFPTWAKPIAAALAVLMLAGGIWLGTGRNNSKNMFSITAHAVSSDEAVELDNSFKPVGELKHFGGGAVHTYDGESLTEEYIIRFADFSFTCPGNNIRSVTYMANNGAFRIVDTDGIIDYKNSDYLETKNNEKYIKTAETDIWTGEIVSTYTVNSDYTGKYIDDEPNICLVSKIDLLSGDCPKALKDGYNKDFSSKEEAEKYMELEGKTALRDLSVDVTVTYNDGSTETKTMVFSSDVEITEWTMDADGEYSYDSKTAINAKIK